MITKEFLEKLLRTKSPAEFYAACQELGDCLDLVDEEGRRLPMDTLGNLIDKLVTVNCKMWHNQEALYEIRRMTADEFALKYGEDLKGLHRVILRACNLNLQRAQLMDEIDAFLVAALKLDGAGTEQLTRPQNKIY